MRRFNFTPAIVEKALEDIYPFSQHKANGIINIYATNIWSQICYKAGSNKEWGTSEILYGIADIKSRSSEIEARFTATLNI